MNNWDTDLINMIKNPISNFNTKIIIHFSLDVSQLVNDDSFIPF